MMLGGLRNWITRLTPLFAPLLLGSVKEVPPTVFVCGSRSSVATTTGNRTTQPTVTSARLSMVTVASHRQEPAGVMYRLKQPVTSNNVTIVKQC